MELIEEKIQLIAKEMHEANASTWTITKIIKELNKLSNSNENLLRNNALQMLKQLDPEAAQIYEAFSKMKVYTTHETIQNFNRGHIIQSLLKETTLSRSVAEKITLDIENQIKDSKIDFLTPAIIRELVNAKLTNYGFEEIRNHYTRVGEPIYDIKKKIQNEPYANVGTKEFTLLTQLPKKIRTKHFQGIINIEDLSGFSTRPYSYSFVAKKESNLDKTIIKNIKTLIKNRKYFYLPPNLYGLTFASGGFIKTETHAKKAASFISEMLKIPDKGFVNSLELFTPTALDEFSENRLNAVMISNHLLNNPHSIVLVDSKYCLKLIDQKDKNFLILNNMNEEYYPQNNKLFSSSKGIDLFVNINLEKLAESKDEDKFFSNLTNLSHEIEKLREIKKEELLTKNYLKDFEINDMKTGIGLTNLLLLHQNFPERKAKEFASKTYKFLSKTFDDYLLFGLSDAQVQKTFEEKTNKKIFSHEVLGFEECLNSKKCCFTGKTSVLKEAYELLDKKVKQIEFIGKN
jgi:hypothetical protein